MRTRPEPFTLHVPDTALVDLQERLARTRFPDQAPGEPWAYGTDLGYLQELLAYWRHGFDWRAQEARLNAWPQFKVPLSAASSCISSMCRTRGRLRALCSCRMAGRARCSSFWS